MFDFPATVKDLVDIPEQYRVLYAAAEDGFSLTDLLASRIAPVGWAKEVDQLQSEKSLLAEQLAEKEKTLSDLIIRNDQHMINQAIHQAVEKAGGSLPLLQPHIREKVSIIEEQGERRLYVMDDEGNPRRTQEGNLFDLDMLMGELQASEVFMPAFTENAMSGGGMKPVRTDRSEGTVNRQDQSAVNANIKEIAAGTVSVF